MLCSEGSPSRYQAVHTHSSRQEAREGFFVFEWAYGGKVSRGKAMYSHLARRFFTVYVGVLYALQIGRRGNVQAVPLGYSCRWCPVTGGDRPIRWGGEFCGGKFSDLCRSRCIKQEFTTADRPQLNGVAERVLGLIETAAMAGRIQARELFIKAILPATESLWAEASHWACDALNHTATSANPANKSPYEMWYGNPLPRLCFFLSSSPATAR